MPPLLRIPAVTALLIIGMLACNVPQLATRPSPTPTPPQASVPSTLTDTPDVTPTAVEPAATPTPTATPFDTTATPSPVPTGPTHGALLYMTDFTTGWGEVTSDGQGRSLPVPGGYQVEVRDHWGHYVYTSRVEQATFYAEADVVPTVCPPSRSGYGLMFHFRGDEQFRAFIVTCEGDYLVFDRHQGTLRTLVSGTLPQDITPSAGSHTLGVLAWGDRLTFYVDGVQVDQVAVEETPLGDVGLYVKTEEEAITVIYTRLAVFAP